MNHSAREKCIITLASILIVAVFLSFIGQAYASDSNIILDIDGKGADIANLTCEDLTTISNAGEQGKSHAVAIWLHGLMSGRSINREILANPSKSFAVPFSQGFLDVTFKHLGFQCGLHKNAKLWQAFFADTPRDPDMGSSENYESIIAPPIKLKGFINITCGEWRALESEQGSADTVSYLLWLNGLVNGVLLKDVSNLNKNSPDIVKFDYEFASKSDSQLNVNCPKKESALAWKVYFNSVTNIHP